MTRDQVLEKIGPPGTIPTGLPVVLEKGCRECGGSKERDDYAQLWYGNEYWQAHRLVYTLLIGLIPEDKPVIMHLCNNPPCCEPSHLKAGTHAENIAYRGLCGRTTRGDQHWSRRYPERVRRGDRHRARTHPESIVSGERVGTSKLTRDKVRRMRVLLQTMSGVKVAKLFGISTTQVSRIRHGESWKETASD